MAKKFKEQTIELDIDEVEFDDENPRIRGALEKYSDKITFERIIFALQSQGDEKTATAGFGLLQSSVRAYGGIDIPIRVIEKDGRKICIDGNSRLAIYHLFRKNKAEGNWNKIPATIVEGSSQEDIEKIRITAHLVSARPWPAYERAKYLNALYNTHFMSPDRLVELCGGNKADIMKQIDAFNDMNEHYRERLTDDSQFDNTRFSGFVELQNQGIKEAVLANFTLDDFGDWIKNGNIRVLGDVRSLPKVLSDKDATKTFIDGGVDSIKEGARIVDEKNRANDPNATELENAKISSLVQVLNTKISSLPLNELMALGEDEESLRAMENLSNNVTYILEHVGK